MDVNLSKFEISSARCSNLENQLKEEIEERDDGLFKIKRALDSGTWSTQDEFLDLCIYEFKKSFLFNFKV